jgi:fructokinase
VILVIGEILFDVFPNYRRLGGAPFNFAYHLKNLGFNVRFVSKIGKDNAGKEILNKLESARFNLADIQLDKDHPTGHVDVRLDKGGAPQFDIISDVAYDYIDFIPEYHLDLINAAQMIYFGSLIQRSKAGYANLQAILTRKPSETLNFYDINLRPGCYTNAIIEKSLLAADILKLNNDELEKLKQMLSLKMNKYEFVRHLMETHSISTVSLTKGEFGSELFTNRGNFISQPTEPRNTVDSVGAGDAYATMLVAGLLKGWQPEQILDQSSFFASRICQIKGAIPDSVSFYDPFNPLFKNT